MDMFSATRGDKTILVTKKMFNTVYKAQGYVLGEPLETPQNQEDEPHNKPLAEMTPVELRAEAKKRGIKEQKAGDDNGVGSGSAPGNQAAPEA